MAHKSLVIALSVLAGLLVVVTDAALITWLLDRLPNVWGGLILVVGSVVVPGVLYGLYILASDLIRRRSEAGIRKQLGLK